MTRTMRDSCRISRDTFSGRSLLSTTPFTKDRYLQATRQCTAVSTAVYSNSPRSTKAAALSAVPAASRRNLSGSSAVGRQQHGHAHEHRLRVRAHSSVQQPPWCVQYHRSPYYKGNGGYGWLRQ
eukprot:GHRQ01034420.1.p1 GENE.GHRQ01034420.1~~GHRQ01034420.1.p1  ORF type:complete len:124 (+),score=20.22 GHRQ01034420.1:380-751(+)